MAEKITIAEIDVNINSLIKSTADVKKEIDKLKKEQTELTKAGESASEAFVQNASDLKVLTSAYNQNIKVLASQTQATTDLTIREQLLAQAYDSEVTSIAEAREQNKLLNKLRNEANATTEEGREEIERLNALLDRNNEFIKENGDAYLKQKINIGNYSESIKTALSDLNLFNGGLGGFIERSKEAGGVGNLVKGSLTGMAQGFAGVTKASLAFIATPIGAVLALLVGAFALIQNALSRSEDATNKLKGAFSIFSGIINTVLKALEPLGEFLIDGIVMGLELAGKAVEAYIDLVSGALEFLGFDEASKAVSDFNDELKNGVKSAKDLAQAEAELEKAQRRARLTQLQFQKDAEKLRQLRDDETLSTQERIKANEDLGNVLKEQLKQELAIANLALVVANKRIEQEGRTKEALDAQLDALTQIADIEERITGQQSEQLVNRNSLIKEANDRARELRQKRIDDAIRESKALIDLFVAEQGFKKKELEDEFTFEQSLTAKRLALLKQEFDAGKLSRTEYEATKLDISNEFLQKQAELTVEFARRDLDAFIENSKSIIDTTKFISDQIIIEENARLTALSEQKKSFAQLQFQEGLITEFEFQQKITQIQKDEQAVRDANELARKEQKKEADRIDLENQRLIEDLIFQDELAIQAQRLEQQRLLEVANAERTGADITKINQKFALLQRKIDLESQKAKVDAYRNSIGEVGALLQAFGIKNKNLAISFATADAFLAATSAYLAELKAPSGVPGETTARAIFAGAKALGFGLANVAKIAKTETRFEKGGVMEIGGNRHSNGGTKFVGSDGTRFEAERGELIGVLNRNASKQFMSFNDAFGSRGSVGTTYAENGGIIARGLNSGQSDLEQIAILTAQAFANAPTPIVTVEDINRVGNNVRVIENGAEF
jgi:hypothetical protein